MKSRTEGDQVSHLIEEMMVCGLGKWDSIEPDPARSGLLRLFVKLRDRGP